MEQPVSRRDFFQRSSLGLAVAGTAAWTLRADAAPTEASGSEDEAFAIIKAEEPAQGWQPTEDKSLWPYDRAGAPFRGKITPPMTPGKVLLITGRVWGADTRRPLASAGLDIWQADANGRYDNDDPQNPPAANVFINRARLITDHDGYYEYQTIHPGPYQTGPNQWRPSHIHYLVQRQGYRQLITQLYFRGDPHNKTDRFIKESLIVDLEPVKVADIVLAKA